jgi:hypothetical protein
VQYVVAERDAAALACLPQSKIYVVCSSQDKILIMRALPKYVMHSFLHQFVVAAKLLWQKLSTSLDYCG